MTLVYSTVLWSATGWSFWHSLYSSAQAMLVATVLGIVPFQMSRRLPWPAQYEPGFVLRHLFVGLLYASLWIGGIELLSGLQYGWPGIAGLFSDQLPQRLFVGGMFYSLIAAISYGSHNVDRARTAEQRAAEAEAAAARARLAVLQSRLHPHFLFNALNTVAELMHEDVNAAEDAIEKLGDALRTLLERSDDLVSFEEEWAFVEQYLTIEKFRLADRLRLQVDIDPGCKRLVLPAFTVQTLVENAIKHGISNRSEGGCLEISAALNRDLILRVQDDGPGPISSATGGHGVGLSTLRTRLASAYGDNASLTLKPGPISGAVAEVRIPVA